MIGDRRASRATNGSGIMWMTKNGEPARRQCVVKQLMMDIVSFVDGIHRLSL